MIRDPSDGTVREAVEHHPEPLKQKAKLPESDEFGTGLRQPTRTDAQLRLEQSREWLKQYRQAIDDANRMNEKGEVTK